MGDATAAVGLKRKVKGFQADEKAQAEAAAAAEEEAAQKKQLDAHQKQMEKEFEENGLAEHVEKMDAASAKQQADEAAADAKKATEKAEENAEKAQKAVEKAEKD